MVMENTISESMAKNALKVELRCFMQGWLNASSLLPEWEALKFMSHGELETQMADAAFAVLDSCIETNKFMKREGMLKDN